MRARIFSAILLGLSALLAAAPMGTAQAQDTPAQYAPVQYYGPPPGYGGPGMACSRWTVFCPASAAPIPATSMMPKVPPTGRMAIRIIISNG